MSTTIPNKNQNSKALVVMAILGLLGLNVYQFVNNKTLRTDNMNKETELVQLEDAKSTLEKEYQQAVNNLEEMKTNNEELNKVIDTQKEDLRLQKEKISALLKDSKNLSSARKELDALRSKGLEYTTEINRLKSENEQLASANTSLTTEKVNLSKEVESKNAENVMLNQTKAQLTSEKESLSQEKSNLSKKVNRASSIKVEKIKVSGFKTREGKKPNGVSKAAEVNFLRFCFKTGINMNADAGSEKFIVRVINPTGETIAVESGGSGVTINEATGEQMRYTTIIETDYSNAVQEVCGDWNNPNGFAKGVYQIEVYNKGFLVGTSTLKLK